MVLRCREPPPLSPVCGVNRWETLGRWPAKHMGPAGGLERTGRVHSQPARRQPHHLVSPVADGGPSPLNLRCGRGGCAIHSSWRTIRWRGSIPGMSTVDNTMEALLCRGPRSALRRTSSSLPRRRGQAGSGVTRPSVRRGQAASASTGAGTHGQPPLRYMAGPGWGARDTGCGAKPPTLWPWPFRTTFTPNKGPSTITQGN